MSDDELRDLIEADRAAKCDLTREWRGGASLGFEIKERAVVAEDALRKAAAEAVPRLLDENAALRKALSDARRRCAGERCKYWDPIPTGGIAKPCTCGTDDHNRRIDTALAGKEGA